MGLLLMRYEFRDPNNTIICVTHEDGRQEIKDDPMLVQMLTDQGLVEPFVPEPPRDPRLGMVVDRYQIRVAADELGHLSMLDGLQLTGRSKHLWESGFTFSRLGPLWLQIATAANMTDEDQDALFAYAASI